MKVLVATVRRFNPHELWVALRVLVEESVEAKIISTSYVVTDEAGKAKHQVHGLLSEEDDYNYDGLMLVSGNPQDTEAMWTDPDIERLVKGYEGKPTAAICAAVPGIRYVAEGKKVTGYPLVAAKDLLERAGATIVPVSLVTDGNLVTAEHQMATIMWTENFTDLLYGREVRNVLHLSEAASASVDYAKKPIPEIERMRRLQAGVTGPAECPVDGFTTTTIKGRVTCPKCWKDWTDD